MTATSPVLKQIAGLPKLSHAELKALWREYFGVEPPAYRRGFLVRGLAHRLQELTYGGLKPAYQARLDAMIEGTEKPNGAGRPGRRPRQDVHLLEGTKLLREWRGVTHEVTVIDGGYEHQGKRYRSLSAVARAITGTQWSGPLFFGLRKTGSGAMSRPEIKRKVRCAVYSRKSSAKKAWSWPSTASTPSARPALPTSTASAMKAGSPSTTATTMAATAAARWSARRCSG